MSRFPTAPSVWLSCLICGALAAGCNSPAQPSSTSSAPVPAAPALKTAGESRPAAEGFTTTASGLKYKILAESPGKKPTAADTVTVNYRGWLDDGSEFDAGDGITFPLGGVIPGWTEGLQLVGEGGTIELEIPADLAYGDRALPGIPAGSTLHFEVKLLKVE